MIKHRLFLIFSAVLISVTLFFKVGYASFYTEDQIVELTKQVEAIVGKKMINVKSDDDKYEFKYNTGRTRRERYFVHSKLTGVRNVPIYDYISVNKSEFNGDQQKFINWLIEENEKSEQKFKEMLQSVGKTTLFMLIAVSIGIFIIVVINEMF